MRTKIKENKKTITKSFIDDTPVTIHDAKDKKYLHEKIKYQAIKEIGQNEYKKHCTVLFNHEVLNYADTLVINLPGSCHAHCSYCIDKNLRKNEIDEMNFINIIKKILEQDITFKNIAITGGNIASNYFNQIVGLLHNKHPNAIITWNTNGIDIDETYNVEYITFINLHRNSVDENINKKLFVTNHNVLSLQKAKELFKEKLYLRVTVTKGFDLDEYVKFDIPLYLNQLLPVSTESKKAFDSMLDKLNVTDDSDIRRRNQYLTCSYKGLPIRICMGDKLATHVPGRYPMWLNVIILHRSGVISGSWFEDDKVLYNRKEKDD